MNSTPRPSRLTDLLRQHSRILMFSGAGFSTGSGIPDYRGPNGMWNRIQPVYYESFMSSADQRKRYWVYKLEEFDALQKARPNAAHLALADLHRAGRLLRVVTQNVDGLHVEAGLPEAAVTELHGTNRKVQCQSCGARQDAGPVMDEFRRTGIPPQCTCGGWWKPATISFGQALDPNVLQEAFAAADECDLVLAAGSTLSVHPAAVIPLQAARRGVPYVICNQGPTEHDDGPEVTLRLEGDISECLPPAIAAAIEAG